MRTGAQGTTGGGSAVVTDIFTNPDGRSSTVLAPPAHRRASGSDAAAPAEAGRADRLRARVSLCSPRAVMVAAALVQLLVLVGLSLLQWSRGALTYDFGLYGQAAWLIAHGHLDPQISLNGLAFLRNNAELAFWLVGLIAAPFGGNPLVLLLVQDVVLVLTGALALRWVAELAGRFLPTRGGTTRVVALSALAVLCNPWCYESALFDFHTEVLAGLGTVIACRALWRGSARGFVLGALLVVATGTAGAIEGVGLGVAALLMGRGRARAGALVAGGSGAWLALLVGLGLSAQGGGTLSNGVGFGYLLGAHPSVGHILAGVPHLLGLLAQRAGTACAFLAPVGLVGAFSRIGLAPVIAVFLPPMAAQSGIFFRPAAAFQVWPVLPVVLVASIEVMLRARPRLGAPGRLISLRTLTAAWAALGGIAAVSVLGGVGAWLHVSPAAAATLAQARRSAPAPVEVVASQGVIGRFAARSELFAVMSARAEYPVRARAVLFVLAARAGVLQLAPSATERIERSLALLPGRLVERRANGVLSALWHPPAGIAAITLPVSAARPRIRQ